MCAFVAVAASIHYLFTCAICALCVCESNTTQPGNIDFATTLDISPTPGTKLVRPRLDMTVYNEANCVPPFGNLPKNQHQVWEVVFNRFPQPRVKHASNLAARSQQKAALMWKPRIFLMQLGKKKLMTW